MKTDYVPMVTKHVGAEGGDSPVGLRAGRDGSGEGEEEVNTSAGSSASFDFYTESDGASAAKRARKQSRAVTQALNAMGLSLDDLKTPSAAGSSSTSTQDSADSAYVLKQQAKLFLSQKAYNDAQANTERTRQQRENILYQQTLFDVVQRLEDQMDHKSGRFQPDPTGLIRAMLDAKSSELMRALAMERD
eukprot:1533181-Rhodomonas_salina.1